MGENSSKANEGSERKICAGGSKLRAYQTMNGKKEYPSRADKSRSREEDNVFRKKKNWHCGHQSDIVWTTQKERMVRQGELATKHARRGDVEQMSSSDCTRPPHKKGPAPVKSKGTTDSALPREERNRTAHKDRGLPELRKKIDEEKRIRDFSETRQQRKRHTYSA